MTIPELLFSIVGGAGALVGVLFLGSAVIVGVWGTDL